MTGASAGVSSTGAISRPTDATNTMTALSHGHALPATTISGGLSKRDVPSTGQWQADSGGMALPGEAAQWPVQCSKNRAVCNSGTAPEALRQSYSAITPPRSRQVAVNLLTDQVPRRLVMTSAVWTPQCIHGIPILPERFEATTHKSGQQSDRPQLLSTGPSAAFCPGMLREPTDGTHANVFPGDSVSVRTRHWQPSLNSGRQAQTPRIPTLTAPLIQQHTSEQKRRQRLHSETHVQA